MVKSRYLCINFGKCRIADVGRTLRIEGRTPRCPSCGEPLIPAKSVIVRAALPLTLGVAALVAAVVWFGRPEVAPSGTASSDRLSTKFFTDSHTIRLTDAALKGDSAGIAAALASGADPNARGRDGITPLHVALLNFSLTGFQALLDAGADPNIPAANGDSPMAIAALFPDSSYLGAALRHGGKPDALDARKRTPLMLAAATGRLKNVRLLIDARADPNARDWRGNTPLIYAFQATKPSLEIARALILVGARPTDANPAGLSARDYAATYEDPALMEIFTPR